MKKSTLYGAAKKEADTIARITAEFPEGENKALLLKIHWGVFNDLREAYYKAGGKRTV